MEENNANILIYYSQIGCQDLVQRPEELEKTPRCYVCGAKVDKEGDICHRCSILKLLYGSFSDFEKVKDDFWDRCPECDHEGLPKRALTPEKLLLQCRDCGEIFVIPFTAEDLKWYISRVINTILR